MNGEYPKSDGPVHGPTLTDFFVRDSTQDRGAIKDLEQHRIEYELLHGPTDQTQSYTSQLAGYTQVWYIENEPAKYWKGLPPFYRDYLKEGFLDAIREGWVDDLPDIWISALTRGRVPFNAAP